MTKLWTRRRVLGAMAAAGAILAKGCRHSTGRLPRAGALLGAAKNRGHRVRTEVRADAPVHRWESVQAVVVGGGIAGLASCRELERGGLRDFVLLELEDQLGGTARGDEGPVTSYPWGAHYLPAPPASNRSLVELLDEMGLVTAYDAQGNPQYVEECLCRDPEERLYYAGIWHEDLFPGDVPERDRLEWSRFRSEVDHWVTWRDAQGRRAFDLPIATASTAPEIHELDQRPMTDWLDQHDFRSPLVRWEVDYACRDDYGARSDQTSAWAGLFYFASRVRIPGESPQPFLTWPEGNAKFVRHLARGLGSRVRTGMTVVSIRSEVQNDSTVQVVALPANSSDAQGWKARHVIFAGPQFVARHVIRDYARERGESIAAFSYSPWLVANLHLSNRPKEAGFPPAWDNVIRDSPGLGYVIATHQTGRDHGPTVFTYYRPVCEFEPREGRAWLEQLSWEASAELVLSDLEQAHPDLRSLVEKLDVMHWGHAMIRPVPGFRTSAARSLCERPFRGIYFANTDLSGVALMEEAFHHGQRAALELLAAREDRG